MPNKINLIGTKFADLKEQMKSIPRLSFSVKKRLLDAIKGGLIKKPEDLTSVKGIGPATAAKILEVFDIVDTKENKAKAKVQSELKRIRFDKSPAVFSHRASMITKLAADYVDLAEVKAIALDIVNGLIEMEEAKDKLAEFYVEEKAVVIPSVWAMMALTKERVAQELKCSEEIAAKIQVEVARAGTAGEKFNADLFPEADFSEVSLEFKASNYARAIAVYLKNREESYDGLFRLTSEFVASGDAWRDRFYVKVDIDGTPMTKSKVGSLSMFDKVAPSILVPIEFEKGENKKELLAYRNWLISSMADDGIVLLSTAGGGIVAMQHGALISSREVSNSLIHLKAYVGSAMTAASLLEKEVDIHFGVTMFVGRNADGTLYRNADGEIVAQENSNEGSSVYDELQWPEVNGGLKIQVRTLNKDYYQAFLPEVQSVQEKVNLQIKGLTVVKNNAVYYSWFCQKILKTEFKFSTGTYKFSYGVREKSVTWSRVNGDHFTCPAPITDWGEAVFNHLAASMKTAGVTARTMSRETFSTFCSIMDIITKSEAYLGSQDLSIFGNFLEIAPLPENYALSIDKYGQVKLANLPRSPYKEQVEAVMINNMTAAQWASKLNAEAAWPEYSGNGIFGLTNDPNGITGKGACLPVNTKVWRHIDDMVNNFDDSFVKTPPAMVMFADGSDKAHYKGIVKKAKNEAIKKLNMSPVEDLAKELPKGTVLEVVNVLIGKPQSAVVGVLRQFREGKVKLGVQGIEKFPTAEHGCNTPSFIAADEKSTKEYKKYMSGFRKKVVRQLQEILSELKIFNEFTEELPATVFPFHGDTLKSPTYDFNHVVRSKLALVAAELGRSIETGKINSFGSEIDQIQSLIESLDWTASTSLKQKMKDKLDSLIGEALTGTFARGRNFVIHHFDAIPADTVILDCRLRGTTIGNKIKGLVEILIAFRYPIATESGISPVQVIWSDDQRVTKQLREYGLDPYNMPSVMLVHKGLKPVFNCDDDGDTIGAITEPDFPEKNDYEAFIVELKEAVKAFNDSKGSESPKILHRAQELLTGWLYCSIGRLHRPDFKPVITEVEKQTDEHSKSQVAIFEELEPEAGSKRAAFGKVLAKFRTLVSQDSRGPVGAITNYGTAIQAAGYRDQEFVRIMRAVAFILQHCVDSAKHDILVIVAHILLQEEVWFWNDWTGYWELKTGSSGHPDDVVNVGGEGAMPISVFKVISDWNNLWFAHDANQDKILAMEAKYSFLPKSTDIVEALSEMRDQGTVVPMSLLNCMSRHAVKDNIGKYFIFGKQVPVLPWYAQGTDMTRYLIEQVISMPSVKFGDQIVSWNVVASFAKIKVSNIFQTETKKVTSKRTGEEVELVNWDNRWELGMSKKYSKIPTYAWTFNLNNSALKAYFGIAASLMLQKGESLEALSNEFGKSQKTSEARQMPVKWSVGFNPEVGKKMAETTTTIEDPDTFWSKWGKGQKILFQDFAGLGFGEDFWKLLQKALSEHEIEGKSIDREKEAMTAYFYTVFRAAIIRFQKPFCYVKADEVTHRRYFSLLKKVDSMPTSVEKLAVLAEIEELEAASSVDNEGSTTIWTYKPTDIHLLVDTNVNKIFKDQINRDTGFGEDLVRYKVPFQDVWTAPSWYNGSHGNWQHVLYGILCDVILSKIASTAELSDCPVAYKVKEAFKSTDLYIKGQALNKDAIIKKIMDISETGMAIHDGKNIMKCPECRMAAKKSIAELNRSLAEIDGHPLALYTEHTRNSALAIKELIASQKATVLKAIKEVVEGRASVQDKPFGKSKETMTQWIEMFGTPEERELFGVASVKQQNLFGEFKSLWDRVSNKADAVSEIRKKGAEALEWYENDLAWLCLAISSWLSWENSDGDNPPDIPEWKDVETDDDGDDDPTPPSGGGGESTPESKVEPVQSQPAVMPKPPVFKTKADVPASIKFFQEDYLDEDSLEELFEQVSVLRGSDNVRSMKKGHYALSLGNTKYAYGNIVHPPMDIPVWMEDFVKAAEAAANKSEGYFNHILVNWFEGAGIGKHKDDEAIYKFADGSVGDVLCYSIDEAEEKHWIDGSEVFIPHNSLYMINGNTKHNAPYSEVRISITMRHIPSDGELPPEPKKPEAVEATQPRTTTVEATADKAPPAGEPKASFQACCRTCKTPTEYDCICDDCVEAHAKAQEEAYEAESPSLDHVIEYACLGCEKIVFKANSKCDACKEAELLTCVCGTKCEDGVCDSCHEAEVAAAEAEAAEEEVLENTPELETLPKPKTFELDSVQKEAVSTVLKALKEGREAVLSGAAGTGKTTIAEEIIHRWGGRVVASAPTHAAVRRIGQVLESSKSRWKIADFRTVHSLFLNFDPKEKNNETPEGEDKPGARTNGIFKQARKWLVVIDEASMINEEQREEILKSVSANESEYLCDIRILWMGDYFQLPPVTGKPGIDLENPDAKLLKVYRNDGNILKYVTKVRGGDIGTFVPGTDLHLFGQQTFSTIAAWTIATEEARIQHFKKQGVADEDMPATLKEDGFKLNEFRVRAQVIVHSNKERHGVNNAIRNRMGYSGAPKVGELMVMFNQAAGFVNGEQIFVEGVEAELELSELWGVEFCKVQCQSIEEDFQNTREPEDRKFIMFANPSKDNKNGKPWALKMDGIEWAATAIDNKYGIDPSVVKMALYQIGRMSPTDEAYYKKNDKVTLPHLNREQTLLMFELANSFRILQGSYAECDFGYSITAHKAQGLQWNRVIVAKSWLYFHSKKYSPDSEISRRWLYTAASRAKKVLTVIDKSGRW